MFIIEKKESANTMESEFENLPQQEETPTITDAQYQKMSAINVRIRDLKQFGFDVRERKDELEKEIDRLDGELLKMREELAYQTQEMQKCYDEFVLKPYNITGQITISETSPHYISTTNVEQF